MLQELLYTGAGVAAIMKEKMEEEMKKLEESGKLKKEDTKSFIEKIEQKGKEEEQKNTEKFKSMLKEIIDELGIATKEDIQKLKDELK